MHKTYDMSIDFDCKNKSYLIGRLVALIDGSVNTPFFARRVSANEAGDSLLRQLDRIERKACEYTKIALDLWNEINDPSAYVESPSEFWKGYYHQRADTDRKRIGQQIREAREAYRYSQKELAGMSGLSEATISKIENGRWSATVDILSKVASALKLQLNLD